MGEEGSDEGKADNRKRGEEAGAVMWNTTWKNLTETETEVLIAGNEQQMHGWEVKIRWWRSGAHISRGE